MFLGKTACLAPGDTFFFRIDLGRYGALPHYIPKFQGSAIISSNMIAGNEETKLSETWVRSFPKRGGRDNAGVVKIPVVDNTVQGAMLAADESCSSHGLDE